MAPPPGKPEDSAQEQEIQRLFTQLRQQSLQRMEMNMERRCDARELAFFQIPFNIMALIQNRTDLLNLLRSCSSLLNGQASTPAMRESTVVALANFVEQEPLLQTFMNIPVEDSPDNPLQSTYFAVQAKWRAQRDAAKKPAERGGKGDGGKGSRPGGPGGCGGRERRSSSRSGGGSGTGRGRRGSSTETSRKRRSESARSSRGGGGSSSGRGRRSRSRSGSSRRRSTSPRRNRRSGGNDKSSRRQTKSRSSKGRRSSGKKSRDRG